jgi:hypothetical protein
MKFLCICDVFDAEESLKIELKIALSHVGPSAVVTRKSPRHSQVKFVVPPAMVGAAQALMVRVAGGADLYGQGGRWCRL